LRRRLDQHRRGIGSQFVFRYRVNRLVYYEVCGDVRSAIAREKEIKG
jgi:putative endonuclease